MNQYSQECSDTFELIADKRTESFSQFWKEQEKQEVKFAGEPIALSTLGLLQSHITMATSSVLLESTLDLALFGIPGSIKRLRQGRKQSIQEFSQSVSNYATSQEVITALSSEIASPREHEDEEQFVSRAKQTLREILERRFGT